MNPIESFSDIADKVLEVVDLIFSMFTTVFTALNDLYNNLKEFNDTILSISADPGGYTGLPVVAAIGTFRYLVGELIFKFIYLCILLGCLLTIYKLVCLLIEAFHALKDQMSGGSYSGNSLVCILKNFFKKK